jgi:LysM domain protein
MKNRTDRVVMLVVIAAVLLAGCMEFFPPATETEYIRHTVHTGETVWEIAGKYADCQTKSFNEFVYSIQHENKLTGRYIQPGDKLIIPLVREKGE